MFPALEGEVTAADAPKPKTKKAKAERERSEAAMLVREGDELTEEVLNTTFAAQKKAGTITFRLVNVEDAANEKIAEDFGAYGTALFLHVHKNGKAEKIDLTEWAFMNANDAAKFKAELTSKLRAVL